MSYLVAVRNLHIQAGVHFPDQDESLPWLQLMVQGIRRVASQHLPARPRLPITPNNLRRVRATLDTQEATWDWQVVWAAMNFVSSAVFTPERSDAHLPHIMTRLLTYPPQT